MTATVVWLNPLSLSATGPPGRLRRLLAEREREAALCYAHTDFHLVSARAGSVADLGPTGVKGAQAVLIDWPRGAFVGGYGADHDLITPFWLRAGGIDVGEPVGRLVLPDGREMTGSGSLPAARSCTSRTTTGSATA